MSVVVETPKPGFPHGLPHVLQHVAKCILYFWAKDHAYLRVPELRVFCLLSNDGDDDDDDDDHDDDDGDGDGDDYTTRRWR